MGLFTSLTQLLPFDTAEPIAMSQDAFVFQVILPFPVPDVERTFSINDPDLPTLEREMHGDIALKLPQNYTCNQLK